MLAQGQPSQDFSIRISQPNSFTHSLIQSASILISRFFFKFSFIIQMISLSSLFNHFSINGLPASGSAATATLQQYPIPCLKVLYDSSIDLLSVSMDDVILSKICSTCFACLD